MTVSVTVDQRESPASPPPPTTAAVLWKRFPRPSKLRPVSAAGWNGAKVLAVCKLMLGRVSSGSPHDISSASRAHPLSAISHSALDPPPKKRWMLLTAQSRGGSSVCLPGCSPRAQMDTLMGSPTKGSPRSWVCHLKLAVEKMRLDRRHSKTGLLESFTTLCVPGWLCCS